jgi:hypothetical protein
MARDDPRCLPSTRTLPRIRWPLQPRSRDRRAAFWATRRPLDDALTSSWVLAGPAPFTRRRPTHHATFRSTRPTTLSRRWPSLARPLFTRTATLFGALRTSVFEANRRLPTSATLLLATYGQPDPDSRFPHRDEGLDLLPFLTHHARPLLTKSGDTRWAAHFVRSPQSRCRFLLLAQVCPTAIPNRPRHLGPLARPE